MVKTFILSSDSHVELDIKTLDGGKVLFSVSVEEVSRNATLANSEKSLDYYLQRTISLGLMDADYHWLKHVTQPQIALWVDMYANLSGLEDQWKWAKEMWGLTYLKQVRNRSVNEKGIVIGEKVIFACFE